MSLWHEIEIEIRRAEKLHGLDPIPLGMGGDEFLAAYAEQMKRLCDEYRKLGNCTWRIVLEEEVAEAIAEHEPEKIREELIQVMAVCARIIRQMERDNANSPSDAYDGHPIGMC